MSCRTSCLRASTSRYPQGGAGAGSVFRRAWWFITRTSGGGHGSGSVSSASLRSSERSRTVPRTICSPTCWSRRSDKQSSVASSARLRSPASSARALNRRRWSLLSGHHRTRRAERSLALAAPSASSALCLESQLEHLVLGQLAEHHLRLGSRDARRNACSGDQELTLEKSIRLVSAIGSFQATQVRLLDLRELLASSLPCCPEPRAGTCSTRLHCSAATTSMPRSCASPSSCTAARTGKTGASCR